MTKTTLNNRSSSSGFTLIEVMIGLVIFGMVATSVFHVLGQGFVIMNRARDLTRVTQIMQYQTENLRGTEWSDLKAQVGTRNIAVNSIGIPYTGATQSVPPFNWHSFKMTQKVIQEKTDLYRATLSIEWTDSSSTQHSRNYNLYFTEKGLNEYYIRASS